MKATRRSFLGALAASSPMFPMGACAQSAKERARYHYAEFTKAMNDATAETGGWLLMAGSRQPSYNISGGEWATVKTIHYEADNDPHLLGQVIERHNEIEGMLS